MSNTNLHTDYIDSNIGLTLIRVQRDTVLRRYYSVLSVCIYIFFYLPQPSRDPRYPYIAVSTTPGPNSRIFSRRVPKMDGILESTRNSRY
jgi:hypothetical protein